MPSLSFHTLPGLPEVRPGMALEPLIVAGLASATLTLSAGDVLLVCQKIVSKSEGRSVGLSTVSPSARARELASICHKDPRLVELVLRESTQVVRCVPDVLIVRHRLGFVVANAAIDQSNVPGGGEFALLLPEDPDASARRLRTALHASTGAAPAVIITDSFGRPWRQGVCGVAIGCAGVQALLDRRGEHDREGRTLQVTQVAIADALAATAALLMGEAAEGQPVVLARGLLPQWRNETGGVSALLRPPEQDLFQ